MISVPKEMFFHVNLFMGYQRVSVYTCDGSRKVGLCGVHTVGVSSFE
jgi:hypothetical protein